MTVNDPLAAEPSALAVGHVHLEPRLLRDQVLLPRQSRSAVASSASCSGGTLTYLSSTIRPSGQSSHMRRGPCRCWRWARRCARTWRCWRGTRSSTGRVVWASAWLQDIASGGRCSISRGPSRSNAATGHHRERTSARSKRRTTPFALLATNSRTRAPASRPRRPPRPTPRGRPGTSRRDRPRSARAVEAELHSLVVLAALKALSFCCGAPVR